MKIKTPLLIIIILVVILIVLAIIFSIFGLLKKEKFSIPDEVFGLSGTIKEIKENILIIDAVILQKDNTQPINQKMKVLINDETKIYKLQFPQAGTLKENDTQGIQPIVIEIKLADLKNGEKVNIQTKENISANIKNKTPFTASIIDVAE